MRRAGPLSFLWHSGASMAYAFAALPLPGAAHRVARPPGERVLPPVALMVPLYILLSMLHLRTSLIGLTIVYTSFALPFCIWNMRAAFQSVAKELAESAFLDGATQWVAFGASHCRWRCRRSRSPH